jgi:hypothetical protein
MVGLITVYVALEGLTTLLTVAVTRPVVAPLGTVATIWLFVQLAIDVACVPLKLSVLLP